MSENYVELLEGASLVRKAPGRRHELVCRRLHEVMQASVADMAGMKLLPPRTEIRINPLTIVRPDLAIVATANGRSFLFAEVISSDDHRPDTVVKKQIYEEARVPRLWMVDPRYDNVEVYHSTSYGLALKEILAGKESLSEKLIPEFDIQIETLFQDL